MIDICNGCPQFDRVCDGKQSENKKYCFFHHGNREVQYFQEDTLTKLTERVIADFDALNEYKAGCCELVRYGKWPDYYLLKLMPKRKGEESAPVGYVKMRSGK